MEEDLPKTRTRKMMMGYLEVSGDDEVPGVIQDPRDRRDREGPKDRWDPGEYPGDYLSTGFGGHAPTIPKCEYNSGGKIHYSM